MADKNSKNMVVQDKREMASPAEQTRPGRVFTPEVDIYETDKGLVVLADMPGVKAEDLSIDLRENVLTISGDVETPEAKGEQDVLREYFTGRYLRQFSLSSIINQAGIEAQLSNGVMKLTLPKVEKAQPRKIQVQTG